MDEPLLTDTNAPSAFPSRMEDSTASHDGPAPDGGGDGTELEGFIAELTNSQTNLRAYILASIGNHADAADILQRANMVLWKNAASFRPGAEFMPWAVTIAKYEILSYYRDRGRDRHVFSEEVATLMLQTAQQEIDDPSDRQDALRRCLRELPEKSRQLVHMRYESGRSIRQIAANMRRSENAIKCAFVRVRKTLESCVDRRMQAETR